MTVEYDGSLFSGWQVQPNRKTVQGELQKALLMVVRLSIPVVGSGRTDVGVHARGQVFHMDLPDKVNLSQLKGGLNFYLKKEAVIHKIEVVEDDFHSRFDATSRQYLYYISERPTSLLRNFTMVVNRKLNVSLLNKYIEILLGEHDFTTFSKTGSDVENYDSIIKKACWYRYKGLVILDIRAVRFLRGMVRAIVGTTLHFEKNRRLPEDFEQVFFSNNRSLAQCHAPAQGLFLEQVEYLKR